MKSRPIIFSGESVRAILEGRKTQTRRVIKHGKYFLNQCKSYQHHPGGGWWGTDGVLDAPGCDVGFSCPYGVPGDRLWVRETWWKGISAAAARCIYADDARLLDWRAENYKKHSPLFMPRAFSRLTLEVVSICVERVQEISEQDAIAEGVDRLFSEEDCRRTVGLIGTKPEDHGWKNYLWHGDYGREGMGNKQSDAWPYQYSGYDTAVGSYSSLWEKINAKRGFSWASNPWVWVVEFKVDTAEHLR